MRLPYLSRDELSPQGQEVWELIHATRGERAVDSDGHLAGPFNAFVHCPSIGIHLSKLGAELRFGSSLDPRLLELAVITTGARWRAEFEWWAHAALARQQGIPDEVIEDIRSGRIPDLESGDERIVHSIAKCLVETGAIDDATYEEGLAALGSAAMVELVFLCGYYTTISFVLNAFDVPLPDGAPTAWKGVSGNCRSGG